MRRLPIAFLAVLLSPPTLAVGWRDYELGEFYPPADVEDPVVVSACEAVVHFGNATGFLISPDGLVLTNHHVRQSFGRRGFVRRRFDGRRSADRLSIELVAEDAATDVALYRVEGAEDLPWLPLTTETEVGQDVFVVGHPKGLGQRVSFGTVLAEDLVISGKPSVEYSAQTWWGSSGSPVIDRKGRAIAIHWGWDSEGLSHGRLTGIPIADVADALPRVDRLLSGDRPSGLEIATTLVESGVAENAGGRSLDRIEVELVALDPDDLREIESVEYHLHPTFARPIVAGDPDRPGFPVDLRAWGFFDVRAIVRRTDGSREIVEGVVRWRR